MHEITITLKPDELRAVLALVGPEVSAHPDNRALATAETKLDVELLTHEESE